MSRVKQKRTNKAVAATALGAGLGLSLAGGASASPAPSLDVQGSEKNLPDQRLLLGDEEMADVSLATFHLFDKENLGIGLQQVAWVGGCRGCRGCGCRGCAWRGCRGCGGCGGCGCCARWGRCRIC